MNALSAPITAEQVSLTAPVRMPSDEQLKLRETFQDFVAGTFYAQMLKALRQTHDKPAYFHGGQAEEIFQGQLDQQIAGDLARQHGAASSDPLFDAFAQRLRLAHVIPPKSGAS